LAPRDGEDVARNGNNLDCLTDANAALEAKGLFGPLPNQTDPPDKSRSPGGSSSPRAPVKNRLGSTIEKINTAAVENTQENIPAGSENSQQKICQQCCRPFTPRKGNGGRAQKFCSTRCRKAFHNQDLVGNTQEVPNVRKHPPTSQRPTNVSDVGPVVGEDVGIAPPQPDEKPVADAEEINWFTDDCVVLYEQPSTAIYFNRVGALVIRQEGRDGPDDDPFIIIAKNNIEEFLDRLTDICGVPSYPPKG
jgi:hypothetical protein